MGFLIPEKMEAGFGQVSWLNSARFTTRESSCKIGSFLNFFNLTMDVNWIKIYFLLESQDKFRLSLLLKGTCIQFTLLSALSVQEQKSLFPVSMLL